jgi:hypothetical protein
MCAKWMENSTKLVTVLLMGCFLVSCAVKPQYQTKQGRHKLDYFNAQYNGNKAGAKKSKRKVEKDRKRNEREKRIQNGF